MEGRGGGGGGLCAGIKVNDRHKESLNSQEEFLLNDCLTELL